MPTYLEWNNALFTFYFNESKAGESVMLYADKSNIATVGREKLNLEGLDDEVFNNFITAVRENLANIDFITRAVNIQDPKLVTVNNEILENFVYLILTVLAITETTVETNSYYEMLVSFLNQHQLNPGNRSVNFFQASNVGLPRLDACWERLERWTHKRKGEKGKFQLLIAIRYIRLLASLLVRQSLSRRISRILSRHLFAGDYFQMILR